MKFQRAIAASIVAILLQGCAGANIGMRTGNTPPPGGSALPPGNSYSYSSVNVQADVSPGAYFGLAFLGYMLIGIQDNIRSWGYGVYSPRPPALAEDRAVAERDCSQPLEPLSANLRCK